MKKNKEKGKLIVFEGPDFSGKTTQMEMLHNYLYSKGLKVISTKQPGGSELGRALEQLLKWGPELPKITQLMLFMADRVNHMVEVVQPALEEGMYVLSDRYHYSTEVYQMWGDLFDTQVKDGVRKIVDNQVIEPDFVFLLEPPTEEYSLKRLPGKLDNLEKEYKNKLWELQERYLDLLNTPPFGDVFWELVTRNNPQLDNSKEGVHIAVKIIFNKMEKLWKR